jgi:hypothetical protein
VLGRRHWGPLLLRSRVAADPAAPCWLVVVQPAGGGAGPVAAAAPPAPSIQPDRNWSLPVGEPAMLPLLLRPQRRFSLTAIGRCRWGSRPCCRCCSPITSSESLLLRPPPALLPNHGSRRVVAAPRTASKTIGCPRLRRRRRTLVVTRGDAVDRKGDCLASPTRTFAPATAAVLGSATSRALLSSISGRRRPCCPVLTRRGATCPPLPTSLIHLSSPFGITLAVWHLRFKALTPVRVPRGQ